MNISADSPWSQVFGFVALDHVPVGCCVLNSRLEVVFWNKVLERWTGLNRWDILHREVSEFFPHLARPQYRQRLQGIFAGGPPLVLSSQLHGQIFPSTCSDGQARLQHTTVTSIPTHDGTGCWACFAVEDVSEVTRRIADLRETRDQAEDLAAEARAANTAKSQFLANMSHELRTPLNSILLLSGMMAEDQEQGLSEADRNSAQIIHSSGSALLELVNDILDLSKIEAGKLDLVPEVVELAAFLRDIEDSTGLLITHQGLKFKTELDGGAPPAIVTDMRALTQITRNLLSNAAKFTREGQVTLKLSAVTPDWLADKDTVGQWLALAVIDSGPGIAPERQEAVFEPFCQEDGTISREFGGTGLGLSISRQLAEQMGGHLHLSSRQGSGSTFTLYLPPGLAPGRENRPAPVFNTRTMVPASEGNEFTARDRNFEEAVAELEGGEDLAPDCLSGLKILVTDDDMRCLFTITGILEKAGADVLAAASGQDALDKLAENPDLDLVLMDVMMPGMDGRDTMAEIRSQLSHRDLPLICMKGSEPGQGCDNCDTCHSDESLIKPFRQHKLIEKITQLLPVTLG